VVGIEKVATLVNDIASASNEQAMGISQINQGIMQVSEVVQNNSATSEESAAASQELTSQAILLKEMVGKYKLRENAKANGNKVELSPEVLKLIENMYKNEATNSGASKRVLRAESPNKMKIALSDKEFGKY
jgi:methyl-accepting chemotaxis protein